MKRKFLMTLAVVAAMFAGAGNAWAQYTSGSEVAEGGELFLYNIEAQKFLTDGMDWGTHATVDNAGRVITLASTGEGTYSIFTKNYTSEVKQGYVGTDGYVDCGENEARAGKSWVFTPVTVVGYTNVYTIKNSDTQYLTYETSTTKVNVGVATNSNADYWIIVPKSVRDAAGDVTYYLQNTDMNRPWERKIWENEGSVGGKDDNRCMECYNKTYDVKQTIKGLAAGKYELTCQGFYRAGGGGTTNHAENAKLYFGTTEVALMDINAGGQTESGNGFSTKAGEVYVPNSMAETSTVFSAGHYAENKVTAVIAGGDITIGIKKSVAVGADWTIFDNFKLKYLGEDLSDFEAPFNEAKEAAKAVDQKKDMNSTVLSNLQAAITNYGSKIFADFTKIADVNEAITALNNAANAANTSIAIYAAIAEKLATLDQAGQTVFKATEVGQAFVAKTYTDADCTEAFKTAALSQTTDGANMTLALANPSFEQDINTGWTQDGTIKLVRQSNTSFEKDGQQYAEFWQPNGTANMYQTLTVLKEGRYKVTARVKARGVTSASVYANGASADVEIADSEKDYEAEVNVFEDAELKVGFTGVGTGVGASWFAMDNFRLTYVRQLTDAEKLVYATAEDYTALNEAITTAEAKTLGFLKDEYAPYTNIDACTALAAAKAIDQKAKNEQARVQAATKALNNAAWTANAEEVNAVYDGSFNLTTATSDSYTVPTGWTNVGYNTRVYNQSNKGSNTGVDAGSQGACLFAKFTTEYGTVDGYTMPLKKGLYSLSFIYGGWNEVGTRDIKVYNAENNAEVSQVKVTAKDNKAHTTTSSWSSYDGNFYVPADGNYILSFYRQNTTSQNQICISDVVIKSMANPVAVARTTATDKLGTICLPYAITTEGATLYSAAVEGNTVTLTAVETAVAGTPYIYQATADTQTFAYASGKVVAAPVSAAPLTGVFTETTVPENSYVMQTKGETQAFYKVSGELKLSANKAYLTVSSSEASLRISFGDDEATAINSVISDLTSEDVQIYDINGRKLQSLQKGINIVNGKKVLVK